MKWEDYRKARTIVAALLKTRYQETGKECSTTEQMIVKDNRGKAIAWHSVSRQMTCYHESDVITVQILSEHFAPSLRSAFCTSSEFCTQSAVCILQFLNDRFSLSFCNLCYPATISTLRVEDSKGYCIQLFFWLQAFSWIDWILWVVNVIRQNFRLTNLM